MSETKKGKQGFFSQRGNSPSRAIPPTRKPEAGQLPKGQKGQSKRASAAEAVLNVMVGFWISVAANYWLLPLWGYSVSPNAAIEIGIVFTWVSLVRSYLLRRVFNWLHVRKGEEK